MKQKKKKIRKKKRKTTTFDYQLYFKLLRSISNLVHSSYRKHPVQSSQLISYNKSCKMWSFLKQTEKPNKSNKREEEKKDENVLTSSM